ncbi:MAG TPA: hypothetical protein DC034_03000 [Clostridium sp.]|jgi:hypothetical protein|uniref:ABC transporter permease n=1 Tax=Clostridium lapidicellarium TaxID=3240931 RepID=A0ABV4DYQ4_9CLOT|nr:hypothetical protein [Clostridiales bacterium]HBC95748.1 hypothetical protein [Clostridium sp.]
MFKFVKYDLEGCFKDFVIMICTIIILNLLLLTRINLWDSNIIIFLNLVISFVAEIIVIVWNIKLFSRDIYEGSAYLVFTTPKSGKNILINKIITAILQCLIVLFFLFLFTAILVEMLNLTQGFTFGLKITFGRLLSAVTPQFIAYSIFVVLIVYISFLLTVYLSLALGRVAIKNRKLGKLGTFIIFVVLCIIQVKVENAVSNVFPQGFMLKIFNNEGGQSWTNFGNAIVNTNNPFISGVSLNIAEISVSLIFIIAMFYATAYIIENKLDL